MKILVVSNMYPDEKHPSYGVFVKNFCNQLNILGIKYDLSVMKKADRKAQKILYYLKFYIMTFCKCLFGKHDLIYIHYASHSSAPVLAARKFKKMTIYTNVHGSDVVPENEKQEKLQKYTRKILGISKKIIVPSVYFKKYVVDKYGVPEKDLYVVHSGGVDQNVFYMEKLEAKNNVLQLGYVGRISHGKGWDTMLKACADLKDIEYNLVIVGSGPEEEKLDKLIKDYDLEKNITRYGLLPQNELRKVYNAIDVFLFPTEREGESLGLVAIEAMACGTPVISSNFAAPADYIVDGVNGFKFEKGNEKDLERAIIQFNNLPGDNRKKLQQGALETAETYSAEKILEQMKLVLAEY